MIIIYTLFKFLTAHLESWRKKTTNDAAGAGAKTITLNFHRKLPLA
jgi:hypothetical protein